MLPMRRVSAISLWLFTLLPLASNAGQVASEENYGSFGAQVSDGSELKHYNALFDQLGHLVNFQKLGSVQPGSPVDNYAALSKLSDIYVQIVKENGNPYIPDYKSNTLALKNIQNFRTYANESMLESAFKPNNETCGAAIVFLYPTLVASTLQDIKPEYIEPQSTPTRITALRQAAQQDLRNDRNVLEGMCNTNQLQPALEGIDNFLSMLRSDSSSFLMTIAADKTSSKRQPTSIPIPKEPYPEHMPVAPHRPYVADKAEKYANCSALISAFQQFLKDNGLPSNEEQNHDMMRDYALASIVYSDADKYYQRYQPMLNNLNTQMRSHPDQVKYWANSTNNTCVVAYNSDLSAMQPYMQDARNEYADLMKALLQSMLNNPR
ncbi:hypothetical protein [Pseudomonas moorei]|uniref:Uncharacterized protein n=1 Tax=Pseudomonas moorei TaxID=395599 RepID=A0A1H1EIU7_9PSED|nr:hypothetical protein [Pseudomonas moorei]KAB0507758.1 hypothetical protein F7R06_06285 [Pseudomonas moorei]SDQ88448.1 hypothetical protein SAMN04490195_2213 [Pseudomonas moorei]